MGYIVVLIAILLAVLVIFCLGYILSKKPDDPATDDGPMPLALRRILIGYFLLVGALYTALLVDLNMMDFPEAAVSIQIVPAPTPTPTPPPTTGTTSNPSGSSSGTNNQSSGSTQGTAPGSGAPGLKASSDKASSDKSSADKSSSDKSSSADKSSSNKSSSGKSSADKSSSDKSASTDPVILQVIPRITAGSPPTVYLAVYGMNLGDATIRLNGKERGTSLIGPGLLEAQPEASDIQGKGTITVDVITKDNPKKTSNCIIVPVEKPTARLKLGWYQPYITREIQLLLIVLVAGGLGCLIHGLKSIAVFIGNRIAISSWFWWYITRPLLGMAMAMVFYALLRGGFLAGTPSDAKVISPFGVLGIGALVGMFTDKAIGKLAEIFDLLFRSKADDATKDKLSSALPTVTQLLPNPVKAGSPAGTLTIKGDHLEKIIKVKVGQDERAVKSPSSAQQVTVDLLATDLAAPAHDITITLVDSDNKTYNAGIVKVTT